MIFRHFADQKSGHHSYLIASCVTRQAAIINPVEGNTESCLSALEDLNLRLLYTMETSYDGAKAIAARSLCDRTGALRVAPAVISVDHYATMGSIDVEAKVGAGVAMGELHVEIVRTPSGEGEEIAYQVAQYTFLGESVLIGYERDMLASEREGTFQADTFRPESAARSNTRHGSPIRNYRTTREGVGLKRLILEDLHTSVAEERFTPKEERVVLTYVGFLEEHQFEHPSAAQLSALLGNVDRTAVHVLVHNIRWKQIELERLPLVLDGQTTKWLKGLQTEPEFTPHEQEFLQAYLELVDRNQEPPSGPDVADALGGGRSVQWVRKRAHTIRRKQSDFQQPLLILTRKSPQQNGSSNHDGSPEPLGTQQSESQRGRSFRPLPKPGLELRYGA